jgi:hypothetical protein
MDASFAELDSRLRDTELDRMAFIREHTAQIAG